MNSEKSKTSDSHKLPVNLSDKIYLKKIKKYLALSLKCKITSIWLVETALHISDIFNCYRAYINGMWNAKKLGGITFEFTLT